MNKKPIALLVTDTHLSENNIDLVTSIWQQAIDQCHKLEINQIFFLGDFFHSRKSQPLSNLKSGQRIVKMIANSGIRVLNCIGNHDKMSYDSPDSYMDILDNEPLVETIKAYDNYFKVFNEHHCEEIDNLSVHFLSYFSEKTGTYLERLRNIELIENSKNILLTHIAINGSITNDNEYISNCIPSSEFEKFDTVFVGHFHNRNEFENIVYIGSAYQANYGEDTNKGFTILHSDGSYEFTQSEFPQYRKYSLSLSDLSESEIVELSKEKQEGNNIKLELTGISEQLKSFDQSLLKDLGIEVVLKSSEAIISLDESETTTYDKKSIADAFKSFCEDNKVDSVEYGLKKLELI